MGYQLHVWNRDTGVRHHFLCHLPLTYLITHGLMKQKSRHVSASVEKRTRSLCGEYYTAGSRPFWRRSERDSAVRKTICNVARGNCNSQRSECGRSGRVKKAEGMEIWLSLPMEDKECTPICRQWTWTRRHQHLTSSHSQVIIVGVSRRIGKYLKTSVLPALQTEGNLKEN
jgi:hypothetical protein